MPIRHVVTRTETHDGDTLIDKTVRLLGTRMKDKVTEFEGVVTSISIDLYGCIQLLLTPKHNPEAKSRFEEVGRMYDANRLVTVDEKRVMEIPAAYFAVTEPAEHDHGPAERVPTDAELIEMQKRGELSSDEELARED